MGLSSDYTVRYSPDAVIQLTNPDNPGAVGNDTARLATAVADAQARFEVIIAESYDSTDAAHVAFAVRGVELMLKLYMEAPAASVERELARWEKSLKMLRERRHNAAFSPKHSSNYVPSASERGEPPFDNRHWNDLRIKSPRGGLRDLSDDNV